MFELTNGDLEDIEEAAGVSLADFAELKSIGKVNTIASWIVKRREVPGFTLKDARSVPVKESAAHLKAFMGGVSDLTAEYPDAIDGDDPKA